MAAEVLSSQFFTYSNVSHKRCLSFGKEIERPWIVLMAENSGEELFKRCIRNNSNNVDVDNRMDQIDQTGEMKETGAAVELRSFSLRPSITVESDIDNISTCTNCTNNSNQGSLHSEKNIATLRSSSLTALDKTEDFQNGTIPPPNNRQQFLLSPPTGSSVGLTPKPLRRTMSVRSLSHYAPPSPSLNRSKQSFQTPSIAIDSISAINFSMGNEEITQKEKTQILKRNISKVLSLVYGMFLISLGCIVFIYDQSSHGKLTSEVFSSVIAVIGIIWLIVLHIDLYRYKKQVLRTLKEREEAMQDAIERFSNGTEYIINSAFDFVSNVNSPQVNLPEDQNTQEEQNIPVPPYRFLQGRHSGSFYLKIAMAAFCFGYLIHQGLQLGQHIMNYMESEKKTSNCASLSTVVLHAILPIYAFYQLFVTFKYSNIIINRHKVIARFGLMHLIATCLCFWFNTIVEEAIEDYEHKNSNRTTENGTSGEYEVAGFHLSVYKLSSAWVTSQQCKKESSVLSTRSLIAIPYLYPFAIEYNIILAGVWYIVWQNIGKDHHMSDPHHIRHTINHDTGGEIAYQSNLVINADCHASNKGLFIGLLILLTSIVTVIVFFVAMSTTGFQERAVSIHTGQEGILTFIGLISVIVSAIQINKLDVSSHPITFLDDVLLFVPLPFYFIHGIMSIIAEYNFENYTRLAVHILVTIQVVVQTAFIMEGLRRCSNSQALRYKKLGREIVTFLIILNITLWIVNTFELKSVEGYHAQEEYFGDFVWMFIGHTTLPLMLFYRFHSSVCLADIWKSAYERET